MLKGFAHAQEILRAKAPAPAAKAPEALANQTGVPHPTDKRDAALEVSVAVAANAEPVAATAAVCALGKRGAQGKYAATTVKGICAEDALAESTGQVL